MRQRWAEGKDDQTAALGTGNAVPTAPLWPETHASPLPAGLTTPPAAPEQPFWASADSTRCKLDMGKEVIAVAKALG